MMSEYDLELATTMANVATEIRKQSRKRSMDAQTTEHLQTALRELQEALRPDRRDVRVAEVVAFSGLLHQQAARIQDRGLMGAGSSDSDWTKHLEHAQTILDETIQLAQAELDLWSDALERMKD